MAGTSVVEAMAGTGKTVLGTASNFSLMASLTSDELREMREYEKLVRFRDEVVAGSHPRINPTHLPGKVAQSPNPPPASSTVPAPAHPVAAKSAVNNNRPVINKSQPHQAKKQMAQVTVTPGPPGLRTPSSAPGGGRPVGPAKTEINPVLLEKSDDLIKAEIQLRRQRLERSLKDQLEQRRGANKTSEQLAELDVADIMAKALSLTLATPPVQSTDDTAANGSASSDSFDDNTFYSSRHDTPESNMVSRLPNESDDEMREGSPYEPELDMEPVGPAAALPPQGIPGVSPAQHQQQPSTFPPSQGTRIPGVSVPGLSVGITGATGTYPPSGALQHGSGNRAEKLGSTGNGQPSGTHDLGQVNDRLPNQAPSQVPSPRVYGHDLSPIAPQPTHVFPPAIARQPQLAAAESSRGFQAAPAQVAALRKQPSNGSSPESSPQGNRAIEKKKNKKKKRKADRLATEPAAASPYIKPEPRSPSPLTPQYARPHKRQRQSQQQPLEIEDDEPRYEQPIRVEEGYQERYQPRVVRQERVVGYERADEYHLRHGDEPVLVTSPRYERVYYDDFRVPPPSGYATRPESAQYLSREVRAVRPASRIVDGPYEDGGAAYYREPASAPSRMSVHPAAYPERSQSPVMYERPPAAMLPPKAHPRRIIVDAFGREYLEPLRSATVLREELVSDPRAPYERVLPPRAPSRIIDDDALLYRPASPAYMAPRRTITQPEYTYREAGAPGSNNPMAPGPPGGEYLPSRPELPREYLTRPSTVRPAAPPQPPSYEGASAGYERLEDRAAVVQREYYRATSAHPAADGGAGGVAARYEMPVAYERRVGGQGDLVREYLPAAPPLGHIRSASVRPAEPAPAGRYGELPPRDHARAIPGLGLRGPEHASPTNAAPPPAYHHHQQDGGRREGAGGPGGGAMLPPSGRAYSVVPAAGEAPSGVRREYGVPSGQQQQQQQQQIGERYYGRAQLPPQAREDGEVVFLDRVPRDEWREMR
ncbi:hypothetical protein BT67DRAFT_445368 [Trichocladium antarcticum]|uniref:Uncharacterized protein n=1 Tax=Trichocladium antarcticum TaxID=1450529 RepID=A0AAN6ZAE3_9PEZI|nr:hypothetical protein BT67DRAFT_445368 [Trichocladium antarcticum]